MYILAMNIWGGGFLNPQQFLDVFNNNAWLIIIACGLTIVMIGGGIDISVGGIVALVTMSCSIFVDKTGSILGSMCLAVGIGLAFGVLQGFLVSYLEIQPFIITLAGMFLARGLTTIVNPAPYTAQLEAFKVLKEYRIELPWEFLGSQNIRTGEIILARIAPGALVALCVVLIIFVVLRWTRFGRNLYAIGGNKHSALMLGINVKRSKFFSHVLCGTLAGIAGYTYVMYTGAGDPAYATMGEMKAIASSIIGGTLLTGGVGNVVGTLFGVLTLETSRSIVVTSGLSRPWWQSITTGAMLCFFILLQSVVLSRRKKKAL